MRYADALGGNDAYRNPWELIQLEEEVWNSRGSVTTGNNKGADLRHNDNTTSVCGRSEPSLKSLSQSTLAPWPGLAEAGPT